MILSSKNKFYGEKISPYILPLYIKQEKNDYKLVLEEYLRFYKNKDYMLKYALERVERSLGLLQECIRKDKNIIIEFNDMSILNIGKKKYIQRWFGPEFKEKIIDRKRFLHSKSIFVLKDKN